jgi:hypothetical protein
MALFDAFWMPMYVFDLLCATFCLLSLLCYMRGRWVLSFVCYWAAYRSKELAVMLPLVFALYEVWFARRKGKVRWAALSVFFLASLSFGLQGMLRNPNRANEYTFHFTPAALWTTLSFYAPKIFLAPYAALLLPVAVALSRNRRAWFGLAVTLLFFVPLLFLPGRLFSAYCYVPFTGLAIAFTGLAEAFGLVAVAVFLLVFLPFNYLYFTQRATETLARDRDAKTWITTAARFAATWPAIDTVVFAASPTGFGRTGCEGALRYVFQNRDLPIVYIDDPGAPALFHREKTAFLTWDFDTRQLYIQSHPAGLADASYLDLRNSAPVWQLDSGFYGQEGDHQWTAPTASVHIARPEGARKFLLNVDFFGPQLDSAGPATVHVSLNGEPLPPRVLSKAWWNTLEWDLAPAPAGPVRVDIHSDPAYHAPDPPNPRGLAIGGLGFAEAPPK